MAKTDDIKEIEKETNGLIPGRLFLNSQFPIEEIGYHKDTLFKDKKVENSIEKAAINDEESGAKDEKPTIYDIDSKNFHLYPKDSNIMISVSEEVNNLRENIIKVLEKICKNNIVRVTVTEYEKAEKKVYGRIYLLKGRGSRGVNKGLENYTEYKDANNLYRFITCYKNGIAYTLNFMRFYIGIDNKVNCILKSIQYDVSINGYVNANGIKYPKAYFEQSLAALDEIINSSQDNHFMYNPEVEFGKAQEIAVSFLEFINYCDLRMNKLIDKKLIIKTTIIGERSNHFLKLDRNLKKLEVYEKTHPSTLYEDYAIRKDFDASNYTIFEKIKVFNCIFGGDLKPTPYGIFQIEDKSNEEYISNYHPEFDKVKFFGYLVIFEDYFIHSAMYQIDTTNEQMRNKEVVSISLKDTSTSGCIRVSQDDLEWLLVNIELGTTISLN